MKTITILAVLTIGTTAQAQQLGVGGAPPQRIRNMQAVGLGVQPAGPMPQKTTKDAQRLSVSSVGETVSRERFAAVWAAFLAQHEVSGGVISARTIPGSATTQDTKEARDAFIAALSAGKTFDVVIAERDACRPCAGSGSIERPVKGKINGDRVTCQECHGAKTIPVERTITLTK